MPRYNDPTQSKASRAQTAVREVLRGGGIRVGRRIPSEATLCEKLKLSRKTVRLAIRGLVREGYIESRSGYGHVLASRTGGRTIGVVLGSLGIPSSGPIWTYLSIAVRRNLEARGFSVRFYVLGGSGLPFAQDEFMLVSDVERGILSATVGLGMPVPPDRTIHKALDRRLVNALRQHRLPTTAYTSHDVPGTIGFDNKAVARDAVVFLREHGCVQSGMIVPKGHSTSIRSWIEGFREAMHETGIGRDARDRIHKARARVPVGRAGYEAFDAWWKTMSRLARGKPCALIVPDDQLAEGAVYRALISGVQIPQNLTVLALSIKEAPPFLPCPHYQVVIDVALLARRLTDRVIRLLESPGLDLPRLLLPTKIVSVPAGA